MNFSTVIFATVIFETVKFELHLLSQYFHLAALIIFSLQLRHATRTQNTLFDLPLSFASFSFSLSLIVDVAPRVVEVARLLILKKNKKINIIYYILQQLNLCSNCFIISHNLFFIFSLIFRFFPVLYINFLKISYFFQSCLKFVVLIVS